MKRQYFEHVLIEIRRLGR